MHFEVRTQRLDEKRYVVALAGEIDMYTAPDVKREFGDAIDLGARRLIVDLTATTFIDSTMLGVLIGAQKRLREREGTLAIVASDRNLTKVFEITGLDRVFAIFATREEAARPVTAAG
jgi:anti-sigma B factor antagonist